MDKTAQMLIVGLLVVAVIKNIELKNVNQDIRETNERISLEFELDLDRVTSLLRENRHLKDKLELIQTIKCEVVLEAPKVGE